MDPCRHETILQQLLGLEESEQFSKLLEVAPSIAEDLQARGDLESLRASLQVRFMMMKALALTGRPRDSVALWEGTQRDYGSHDDENIVFWVYSAAVASADTYWQLGNRERAFEILDYCVERFHSHPHPALRGLGIRANVDLSVCRFEEGYKEAAVAQLTEIIQRHSDDRALSVREEVSRATQQRSYFDTPR